MTSDSPSDNWDKKLSAVIGLAIGLVLMGVGLWAQQRETHERATMQETQGTVVDTVSRRERSQSDNKEKVVYAPVIEFLANGDRTRFIGKYESYQLSHGHNVVVRYDPKQPTTRARVVDPLENLGVWCGIGMGGLLMLSSLGSLLPVGSWFSQINRQ
jgi:hypothetical protein